MCNEHALVYFMPPRCESTKADLKERGTSTQWREEQAATHTNKAKKKKRRKHFVPGPWAQNNAKVVAQRVSDHHENIAHTKKYKLSILNK